MVKTNTTGYRRGTRYMFSRAFKTNGVEKLSTFLRVYKRGDYVDIKGCGAFQKGMPYKVYHGRTGRVFNVTPHAVGVVVNKQVRDRVLPKRINVRIEHIKASKSREGFLERRRTNDILKKQAKEKGEFYQLKRQPTQPRKAHFVSAKNNAPQLIEPIPYEFIA
ncbi:ribosomal protein L21-like isoform X1 [Strongylocentrotus purpuratus]|uniref:Large ribosomal subunit protein eL21 n=1 Tax=Strongylocentrotus purpuratus TaxID=7668 RepID=A0A7M7HKE9_STRPU|nr:ribosomal protein L21-like [Strongylocentrotus purpuratus]XP_011665042.1 ribosomal protein L21-like isoform X1 [Strongylocentrotus purpuratus]|eukprot:NP_001229593.1 ribosomal protein L21-like [Strongylocentrotus purpuratus]